ncbi:MAG: hypothetical protein N4A68_07445 [Maledivibacter sp.]|nr:hypothetical protein [Maledivibacter sp.]
MNKRNCIILATAILLGFIILGITIRLAIEDLSQNISSPDNEDHINNLAELYRYQMVPVNDSNIIIFDRKTGKYWRKFAPPNEGPTEWTRERAPNYNK